MVLAFYILSSLSPFMFFHPCLLLFCSLLPSLSPSLSSLVFRSQASLLVPSKGFMASVPGSRHRLQSRESPGPPLSPPSAPEASGHSGSDSDLRDTEADSSGLESWILPLGDAGFLCPIPVSFSLPHVGHGCPAGARTDGAQAPPRGPDLTSC